MTQAYPHPDTLEGRKALVLKTLTQAQRDIEYATITLVSISPVVASSKPYEALGKLSLAMRQVIAQVSGMKVS